MKRPVDIPHKDFTGRDLYVGAEVAFIRNRYREFARGTVLKANPSKVTLSDIAQGETTQRWPHEVIRIG